MGTRSSFVCLAGMAAVLLIGRLAAQGPAAPPPGPPAGGFDALNADRPVLKQFDADSNGRLGQAERTAAREWLAAQPPTGIAAMMGRGGPGGVASPPGTPRAYDYT